MSLHKSLRVANRHVRGRNVLSREERVAQLTEEERWEEGTPVFGLPKTKVHVARKRGKPKKEAEEAAVEETAP